MNIDYITKKFAFSLKAKHITIKIYCTKLISTSIYIQTSSLIEIAEVINNIFILLVGCFRYYSRTMKHIFILKNFSKY